MATSWTQVNTKASLSRVKHLPLILSFTLIAVLLSAKLAHAGKNDYLNIVRQGWGYELRTTVVRRNTAIPVHINGRDLAGASLCLIGERPHAQTLIVLNAFRDLLKHSYGAAVPMRFAGPSAESCGSGRTVVIRLYSGYPPNREFSSDLEWMNKVHLLDLPVGRKYLVTTPGMAQTFFGRRGQGTHIIVLQPAHQHLNPLEAAFHKSILIEELFQSFTFGMDILVLDRTSAFLSKLQEIPFNLHRLPWKSHEFMRAFLRSNPGGLCAFDVFMLHAVSRAPVDQTTDPGFLDYIDHRYDHLWQITDKTLQDPSFSILFDDRCTKAGNVQR